MEFLILNEESIPYKTVQDAKNKFPEFFKILDDALRTQLKGLIISGQMSKHWYANQIGPNFFCRDWVMNMADKEVEQKFKSFASKTNFLKIHFTELGLWERHQLSDFCLQNNDSIITPSLGAACLSEQLSISFASDEYWMESEIEIKYKELTDSGEQDKQATAHNFFDRNSWEFFKSQLEEERRLNSSKTKNLWDQREELFPNLKFLNPKDFQHFRYNNVIFSQLYDSLNQLDSYCINHNANFSVLDLACKTGLTISDESDTVKQNPKLRRFREFRLENEKVFFGLHIKNFSGALRLHFHPEPNSRTIYIGYFGKHLPNKSDR